MGLFDGDLGGIDWGMLAGGMQTPGMLPPAMPQVTPELLAKNAAARGVPPPPVDIAPTAPSSLGGSVGAALTGNTVPMPQARPTDMSASARPPGAPLDITSPAQNVATAAAAGGLDKKFGDIGTALKGVTMPKGPELQKLGTPSAPRATTAIKGGDIIALLQSLNAAPGASGLKLPSTLSQAIGR